VTLTGGDVQVIPTANPDQLGLFQRHELDAVWTVEPWVSRLELEAGGGHPEEAQAAGRAELAAETRSDIKPALIAHAWARIVLTHDVSRSALERFVANATAAGFLRSAPDLSRLVEKP
jgi:NitT/TauT family transport system substrate-binding protein